MTAYLRRPAHVVALSDRAGRTLTEHLRVPGSLITVIANGVPSRTASGEVGSGEFGIPTDSVVVAFVGALAPEKGVDTAIEAVAEVTGVHLLVCGDGPARADLVRLADKVAPHRVHFSGVRDDVSGVYRAADIVVLASKGGDSMPAVLIEAGLAGLPVISCPVGAIEDVVVDEATGLIVPSSDANALAGAIERLSSNPGLRASLGQAARSRCQQRFTIEAVADRWLDVLRRSVASD